MRNSLAVFYIITVILLSFLTIDADNNTGTDKIEKKGETRNMAFAITTESFENGQTIPKKYTCDGEDISVPLYWENIPEGTKSLALICDDPDAPRGTWVHWLVINIPPTANQLAEGLTVHKDSSLAGAIECYNDFGRVEYGGPCPPKGPAHRYYFKLYALDTILELTKDATKVDIEKAMIGHILEETQLMGKYGR